MDKKRLFDLCSLDGVSGREDAVRAYILDALKRSTVQKDVSVDAMGNILVHLHGESPAAKKVLFDAHMDEVGVMITHINDDGTLHFVTIGGIENSALFGQRVRFGDVFGVIGGKAIHQCVEDEKNMIPSATDMVIDIGAVDRDSAERKVKVGQTGTFDGNPSEWENGILCGKALDDRVGCALLLSLADRQPKHDLWLSFSVQEEVGLRGARVVGESVAPDVVVVLDVTTAADVAGSTDKNCVCRMNKGPVVSFADRGTLYDYGDYEYVRSLAEQHGIETQTKNSIAGANNSASIQRSGVGVQTISVSLPCRYLHSPSCVASMTDIDNMERLVTLLSDVLTI